MNDPRMDADIAFIDGWLRERDTLSGPLRVDIVQGGLSNLTYRLSDDTGPRWVLRRPPWAADPAAHDVLRESRIISALGPTPIPVAGFVGAGAMPDGAAFYAMDYVEGVVVADRAAARRLTHDARRRAGADLVAALADLHELDPAAVGLDRLGRGDSYVERQIARWRRQAERCVLVSPELADAIGEALARNVPAATKVSIVHGDYRLNNTIVDPRDGRLRAVLDWELSTLGDPLTDVGGLLVHWVDPQDRVRPFSDSPTAEGGFPRKSEQVAGYLVRAGLPADTDLTFYHAFASWRLGIALDGVHRRFVRRAYGDASSGGPAVAELADTVPDLVGEAARLLGVDAGRHSPGSRGAGRVNGSSTAEADAR